MDINRSKIILLYIVLTIVIVFSFNACGGSDLHPFSVAVINHTDSSITVRYDWHYQFLWYGYFAQEDAIPANDRKNISWEVPAGNGDYIEVSYQGTTIDFSVVVFDLVVVSNCTNGGFLVMSGNDMNGNGFLDFGEVVQTYFACNG